MKKTADDKNKTKNHNVSKIVTGDFFETYILQVLYIV